GGPDAPRGARAGKGRGIGMTCEEVRDELVAYARGELGEEEQTKIEEHLVRCEGCTNELEGARRVLALTQTADEASIKALTQSIITRAIERGASDIHLERDQKGGRVRYRIDGVLLIDRELIPEQYEPVISRLKMRAG